MNVAIVGCGSIGRKRLKAMGAEHKLILAVDTAIDRAAELATGHRDAVASRDWRAAVTHPAVEAVVVSTTNDWLASVTLAAVEAGKHVLVEKPAARNHEELRPVFEAAQRSSVCAWVGFNHRYHPALRKAREIVVSGDLGPLMFVRGRYGHGGRLGYELEWRADPKVSGGGELLDQGIHLIDLARWFLGDIAEVFGSVHTFFWKMPVEDNGFLLLKTKQGQVAWLQASCTEWKNLFSFEILGKRGSLHIEGLGGSYGVERLIHHRVKPCMGPPETTIWEYPGEDESWQEEFRAFIAAAQGGVAATSSLEDALAALEIVARAYTTSRKTASPHNGRPANDENSLGSASGIPKCTTSAS